MLPDPTSVREWLAANDVRGVEVTSTQIELRAGDAEVLPLTTAVQLGLWCGYECVANLRTLLARMFDEFVWLELRSLVALPIASTQHFHCRVELNCFDPAELFHSEQAAAASQVEQTAGEHRGRLSDALQGAIQEFSHELADFRGEMEELLADYLTPKFFTSDQEKIDAFLTQLSQNRRLLVEDCRVLTHFVHRYLDTLEALDEWDNENRETETGANQGLRLSFAPLCDAHHNMISSYPAELTNGSAPEPPATDPAKLAALIRKVDTPTYRRQSLLRVLQDLPMSPDIEGHLLRLAAEPPIQVDVARIIPRLPSAANLVRALIFAQDLVRVTHAFAELADFGTAFEDPIEAWHRAENPPRRPLLRVDLGFLLQSTLLDGMRLADDDLQAELATELCSETRSDSWLTSGLELLTRSQAPQLYHVARFLSRHEDETVSQWAGYVLDAKDRAAARATAKHSEIVEADIVAGEPEDLFEKRMQLWRQPGYATWRYRRDGHRSPLWDDMVERAHKAYSASSGVQDPEVKRNCDAAIAAGCRDAMIYYRRGIVAFGEENITDGHNWFDEALPLFDRYALNPYRSAGAQTLAEWHRREDRREEALRYYEIAVSSTCSYAASQAVRELAEEITALTGVDGERAEFETGKLRPFPSAVHRDTVTALEVSPNGDYALSADETGYVQVSMIGRGDFARTIPIDHWPAHPSGRTLCLWLDDKTLCTGGSDGRIRIASFVGDRLSETKILISFDTEITAMTHTTDGCIAVAMTSGRVCLLNSATAELTDLGRGAGNLLITDLRCSGSWLLGRAETSELEAWLLPSDPMLSWHRPHEGYPLVFAEFVTEDCIMICNSRGDSWNIQLTTGRSSEMQLLQVSPPPIQARFDMVHRTTVWGSASGQMVIEYSTPGRNHIIVHNSLSRLAVSFEHGVLVHVDAARRLACNRFRPRSAD